MSMWGWTDQGASSKQSIENFWKRDTIIGLQFFNLLLHLKCLFFASQVVQRTRELWSYSAMNHPSLCFGAYVLHAKILSGSKYLEMNDFWCRIGNWVNIMQLHLFWPNMKIPFLTICLVFWSFCCPQNSFDLSGHSQGISQAFQYYLAAGHWWIFGSYRVGLFSVNGSFISFREGSVGLGGMEFGGQVRLALFNMFHTPFRNGNHGSNVVVDCVYKSYCAF